MQSPAAARSCRRQPSLKTSRRSSSAQKQTPCEREDRRSSNSKTTCAGCDVASTRPSVIAAHAVERIVHPLRERGVVDNQRERAGLIGRDAGRNEIDRIADSGPGTPSGASAARVHRGSSRPPERWTCRRRSRALALRPQRERARLLAAAAVSALLVRRLWSDRFVPLWLLGSRAASLPAPSVVEGRTAPDRRTGRQTTEGLRRRTCVPCPQARNAALDRRRGHPMGWQRARRRHPSQTPRQGPCRRTASAM